LHAAQAAEATGLQGGADQGVEGTPTFFLNGERVEIDRYEDIEQSIARALAQSD
jgi:protein-disulfide isomerase